LRAAAEDLQQLRVQPVAWRRLSDEERQQQALVERRVAELVDQNRGAAPAAAACDASRLGGWRLAAEFVTPAAAGGLPRDAADTVGLLL
jgi:hypothetical protein